LLGDGVTRDILTDWRTAPISNKLRAMLGFLARFTHSPGGITRNDIEVLRKAGVSDCAFVDAVYICMGFNVINRIADAMDFKVPTADVFTSSAKFMRKFGYKLMSGSWRVGNGRLAFRAREDQSPVDPYQGMMKRLKYTVLSGSGTLDVVIRKAAGAGAEISGAIGEYVNRVAKGDYERLDEDICKLHQQGYSDDQIFEATVSAALGAGLRRLDLALSALRRSSAQESLPIRNVS
jgi:alkylhydroperoxidase family enzyme